MYTRFFGLDQAPFSIAPDPRYLFMSERHREALAHLLYGLDGGGGFVLLTGEIGAGKTTVCRLFLEQIPANCNVAYIFNPKQTVIELLQSICDEFGIDTARGADSGATVKDFVDPLNAFLLASHARQQNNILIIDEAQNLSADVLEQLRLLTNLETSQRKLLQIILIGQPELRSMLARPELEQLAQRIVARFHLAALSADETAQYIAHRLAVAGLAQASPFGSRVMRRIHRLSRGVPRRINLLCDRALLAAYASSKHAVDSRTVTIAAREVFDVDGGRSGRAFDPGAGRGRQLALAAALCAALAVIGLAVVSLAPMQIGSRLGGAGQAERGAAQAANAIPRVAVRPAMTTDLASAKVASGAPAMSVNGAAAAASRPASPLAEAAPPSTQATAPITAPAAAPAPLASQSLRDPAVRDRQSALRVLADAWQVKIDGADVCRAASRQALYCFASRNGLSEIRQLDHPGILTLLDDAGEKYYALLIGLDRNSATLQIGPHRETVTLAALAKRWHGGFTTLWRGPPAYAKAVAIGDHGEAVDWLAARLATAAGAAAPASGAAFDATLSARVREFQLAQGLLPDGLPGPQTLMRLASVAGDQGPRLQSAAMAAAPVAGQTQPLPAVGK